MVQSERDDLQGLLLENVSILTRFFALVSFPAWPAG
jgi:hypothetical protein